MNQINNSEIILNEIKRLSSLVENLNSVTIRKKEESKVGIIKFTKKEIELMPQSFKSVFIANNKIVKYRIIDGLFQARYRRDGYNIEVASKDYDTMRLKFIERLNGRYYGTTKVYSKKVLFSEYTEKWLKLKKQTTKESTYKEYVRSYEKNLKPVFGQMPLDKISREKVQDYLFSYVKEEKYRTAEKLKLQLTCIFDMAYEDYNLPSPMKKIVLPYHESKKGSAFTKKEEKELVEYCIKNKEKDTSSAILVLLYFGLRRSELASIRVIDNSWLECKTSKEKMGKNEVLRKIPFTPMFKQVKEYVDIEKAKNVNLNSLHNRMKKIFPNHHLHELRYTFITRVKESGVNMELSMLWAGHEQDSDVKTSRIDRGYTDYSDEYILSEAEKVRYNL